MDLVIVESPTKAKTISKFLGKGFTVESSYGHIRDLPKSKLGIDIKNNFEPLYEIPAKAKSVVANLKKLAAKADKVILATDEDREGEAIAWHLIHALDLDKTSKKNPEARKIERIAFHEITRSAILEALRNPRELDIKLVDAQQARRVLDRLVGYGLSPFLWRKVRYGLSAGRVQSVAVRLVVERERQIQAFNKEEYWSIEARFTPFQVLPDRIREGEPAKGKTPFSATLFAVSGKSLGKMGIRSEAEAKNIIEETKDAHYHIAEISVKDVKRYPAPPFTTSTLQQEAARKLGFSAKQTMVLAQRLYENGFITYMRTDSVNLASSALEAASGVIEKEFGRDYRLPEPRRYATKSKGAQEAHEAIRPTNLAASSAHAFGLKDRNGERLYDLIWKRTIASQMKEALLEQTSVDVEADTAKKETFRANGQVVKFDGFIRVYTEGRDDDATDELEGRLPKLEKNEVVKLDEIAPIQHFTEPPARYTDATLVKALEAEGIGRPSTYAPTLSTIQDREYVEKIDKKYHPTEIGTLVNDILVEHFPEIVDIKFTSHIEEELDDIAEGKAKWTDVAGEFYGPFKKHLDEKEVTVEKKIEVSTTPCPHCGKPMIIKFGRMGKFLACPEPGVKITLPMPEEAAKIKELEEKTKDERCPICGKPMKVRRGRFGFFLGCVDYSKKKGEGCPGISKIWNKTGFKCPHCIASPDRKDKPGDIVEKKSRGRGKPFYACTRYPDCTFVMNKKPESEAELEEALKHWKENPPKKKRLATSK
jgi:DNA topoisomerase-1